MLLSTSAIHEYKRVHPETRIIYQTFVHNQGRDYRLQYPHGNPGELLRHNPDIDVIADINIALPQYEGVPVIDFKYAEFGGPSLDYPIQAHYWENMGLAWEQGQRFDALYYLQDEEVTDAWRTVDPGTWRKPLLAVTPRVGWAGKTWTDEAWLEVIRWALARDWTPIVFAGERVDWQMRGLVNLSGQLDMRQTAAILSICDHAVMTEGGLSNLRFALGLPTTLLTCATRVGTQIWTPPELTTEIRAWQMTNGDVVYGEAPLAQGNVPACDPCMWRRDHVKHRRADVPPASIEHCPKDVSLRDIPAEVVINALSKGGM